MIEYRKINEQVIAELCKDARPADLDEVDAMTGKDFITAIKESLELSDWALCCYSNGELLGVFGLMQTNVLADIAAPWMIGTNAIYRHQKEFMQASRESLEWMKVRASTLEYFVYCKHATAVRWLQRLGFNFGEVVTIGPRNEKFKRFFLCVQ
ncbi:hypothetical protein [Vibrio proteolyticus]